MLCCHGGCCFCCQVVQFHGCNSWIQPVDHLQCDCRLKPVSWTWSYHNISKTGSTVYQTCLPQISKLCTPVTKIVNFPPKWCTFQIVCTHGKRLLLTLTKCAHTFGNAENRAKVLFFKNSSQSEPQCYTMQEPIYFTYCTGFWFLIKWEYLAMVMFVFFSIMSAIVVGTFMCTVLRSSLRHIHAHNQFCDHHLGTFMCTISSAIIT